MDGCENDTVRQAMYGFIAIVVVGSTENGSRLQESTWARLRSFPPKKLLGSAWKSSDSNLNHSLLALRRILPLENLRHTTSSSNGLRTKVTTTFRKCVRH